MANKAKQKGELMCDVHINSLFVRLAPLQEYDCTAGVHLVLNRHGCLHLGTSF